GGTSGPGRSAFGPNGGGTAVMGTEQFKAAWVKIAQRLRAELGEDLYSSWFARMEPELATDGQAVVSVPTRFLRSWIQSHYIDVLVRTCAIELPEIEQVQIRVRSPGRPALATVAASDAGEAADTEVRPAANNRRPQQQAADGGRLAIAGSPLDRSLTFGPFVVGTSNALANAAASMVAKADPATPGRFNPLYVHSASGLGKTHLLNAIAWRVRETAPERKVLYLSAERFMYHFAAALGAKDMLTFKDVFRSVDLLLIDDFQFLQGRFTQQEFCHTFNSLVDSKRQVVIAADLPPAQLDGIEPRMRSRLAGGLVVDIAPPELELRREILRSRLRVACERDPSVAVPVEVIEFIANRVQGGRRELEGALTRVLASQNRTHAEPPVETAALALRDLVNSGPVQRIKIEDILRVIGKHYNVPKAALLSPRRARSIVRPRQ